jgi:hypothetical protein
MSIIDLRFTDLLGMKESNGGLSLFLVFIDRSLCITIPLDVMSVIMTSKQDVLCMYGRDAGMFDSNTSTDTHTVLQHTILTKCDKQIT